MERINGPDLISSFARPKNPTEFYLKIWQIASGISDIHNVDIVHRDIKPNNMKLDHEGIIKIFDFGLARNTQRNASTLGFVGTHGFSAPELYAENPFFTTSVDTYAFGATALFLATGNLPPEVLKAYGAPVPNDLFKNLPIAISSEIEKLLQSTLSHSPEDRPNMVTIKEALEKHILYNRHQALVVHREKSTYLNHKKSSITLAVENVGSIDVHYDGMNFVITRAEGEVFINNTHVVSGSTIPTSCVLAIGGSHRKNWERSFITFDLSHPEINL